MVLCKFSPPVSHRASETEEVIEVAIEMTLDEWKALQEQSRPKVELNIRKAETAVPSKAVVIHKSKLLTVRRYSEHRSLLLIF